MIRPIGFVLAAGIAAAVTPAMAVSRVQAPVFAAQIERVVDGCGRGWYRNRLGYCRPMRRDWREGRWSDYRNRYPRYGGPIYVQPPVFPPPPPQPLFRFNAPPGY